MGKIWKFYENLNEVVYVTDMDTHELVYMNPKACEVCQVESEDRARGEKCYQILQHRQSPCEFCTDEHLKVGEFYEWQHLNPIAGRVYSLKDTLIEEDGKRYRMEVAIDMTLQKEQEETIRAYTSKESMINEGIRLALTETLPRRAIETFLGYLGNNLKSERVYIFEDNGDGTLNNTFEWCMDGVTPQKESLQNVPLDVVSLWYGAFHKNRNIIIKDLEGIREEDPLVYEYLKPQNIQSLVVTPLLDHGQIVGFYGIDNPPGEILSHISTLFSIVGHFIVSMLNRLALMDRLERMSLYDQLTGLGNRHAMEELEGGLEMGESVGVLYCDVMGLKRVNDTEGHQAGDALLLRVSGCLRRQFGEYALFRVGGDEFMSICRGVGQEELERRARELEADMAENRAEMAIGYVWQGAYGGEFDRLLAEADERMYEDKKARKRKLRMEEER